MADGGIAGEEQHRPLFVRGREPAKMDVAAAQSSGQTAAPSHGRYSLSIFAIGVDEIQYAKGHKYLTLVYQIDRECIRLLWVGKERTIESFQGFFRVIGEKVAAEILFVCSDMWKPYLDVIGERCINALHILDRFHIMAKMSKALDEVRAQETKRLIRDGYQPLLKKSRWCVLKRKENLTDKQQVRLRDLLRYNLQTVRAYLLKGMFALSSPPYQAANADQKPHTRFLRSGDPNGRLHKISDFRRLGIERRIRRMLPFRTGASLPKCIRIHRISRIPGRPVLSRLSTHQRRAPASVWLSHFQMDRRSWAFSTIQEGISVYHTPSQTISLTAASARRADSDAAMPSMRVCASCTKMLRMRSRW